jgi:hypothetical protein
VDGDRVADALDRFGELTCMLVIRSLAEEAPGIRGGLLARAISRSSWQSGLELGLRIGVMDRIGAEDLLAAIRLYLADDSPKFDMDGRETAARFLSEVIK